MKEKLAACDNNEEECEAAYDHTSGTRKDVSAERQGEQRNGSQNAEVANPPRIKLQRVRWRTHRPPPFGPRGSTVSVWVAVAFSDPASDENAFSITSASRGLTV